MASTDARPVPIKNTAFRVYFPILNNTGALVTGAAGLDSERSIDGGTFADCTNEATEVATSSGIYYLDLTSGEMNGDCVVVIVKTSTTDAKTTTLVFYPQENGDIKVDVQSYGGTAGTFASGRPEVNTTHAAGTAWASGAITAAALGADCITNAKIADNALGPENFTSIMLARMGVVSAGTAQSASTTGCVLASGETFPDDAPIGMTIMIFGSTQGYWQAAAISDYVGSTDTVTFDTALQVAPSGTITYILFGTPRVTGSGGGLDAAGVRSAIGLASANLDTQLAALQSDTDNIQTRIPAALVGGRMDANLGAISTDATAADNLEAALDGTGGVTITAALTGNITGNLSGTIGSLAAQAKADVNAEVLDVMTVDTFAEPSGVPAATSTLKDKVNFLCSYFRNKRTQTATTELWRNDADSATLGTRTVSDDGTTMTKGKIT